MYNSIASVELVSHMQDQFTDTSAYRHTTPGHIGMRHRVSVVLHAIANRLEPVPAPAR